MSSVSTAEDDAPRSTRFDLLMLNRGEYCFRDYPAKLVKTTWKPTFNTSNNNIETSSRGLLFLCSQCIMFEPLNPALPLIKLPFTPSVDISAVEDKIGANTGTSPHRIVVKTPAVTEIRPDTVSRRLIHPFIVVQPEVAGTLTEFHFTLDGEFGALQLALVMRELWRIGTLPDAQNEAKLRAIAMEHEHSVVFPVSALEDVGEGRSVILHQTSASKVLSLINIPGKIVLTEHSLFFRAYYDLSCFSVERTLLSQVTRITKRRIGFRHVGLEIYLSKTNLKCGIGQSTLFLFKTFQEREAIYDLLCTKTGLPDTAKAALGVSDATWQWQHGEISNYEFILSLNDAADRTVNDLTQYPIFPWVLLDYTSPSLDLENPAIYRDLSLPIGALNPKRLQFFRERAEDIPQGDPAFLYGTHYSAPAFVLFFLVRRFPQLMLHLQNGSFDSPDRLFSSIPTTWSCVLDNPADVKELTPEFYQLATETQGEYLCGDFLLNRFGVDYGSKADSQVVHDVELPPWATSVDDFIIKCRQALESDFVSEHLHQWVDLVFGYKQRGREAERANNVFYHLTYDTVAEAMVTSTTSASMRSAFACQMAEFGQTPRQLFFVPHVRKVMRGINGKIVGPTAATFTCGWGYNGQLGHGDTFNVPAPKMVSALWELPITQVACGGSQYEGHTAALSATGVLYTWGSSAYGKLGHGSTRSLATPTVVESLMGKSVWQVACGSGHTAAVTLAGEVYTWGWGTYGQLGLGNFDNVSIPSLVRQYEVSTLDGVKLNESKCARIIACGEAHTVLLTGNLNGTSGGGSEGYNAVYAWGWGEKGQLGVGDDKNSNTPRLIKSLENHNVVQVSCGLAHSAALCVGGREVFTWGWDQYGQLGHGWLSFASTNKTPRQLKGIDGVVKKVVCGGSHTIALTTDGVLYSWGWGKDGQLGQGWRTNRQTPHVIDVGDVRFVNVVACGSHNIAVSTDGAAFSWGNGVHGKLGNGNEGNIVVPSRIPSFGVNGSRTSRVACAGGIIEGHSAFTVDLPSWDGVESSVAIAFPTATREYTRVSTVMNDDTGDDDVVKDVLSASPPSSSSTSGGGVGASVGGAAAAIGSGIMSRLAGLVNAVGGRPTEKSATSTSTASGAIASNKSNASHHAHPRDHFPRPCSVDALISLVADLSPELMSFFTRFAELETLDSNVRNEERAGVMVALQLKKQKKDADIAQKDAIAFEKFDVATDLKDQLDGIDSQLAAMELSKLKLNERKATIASQMSALMAEAIAAISQRRQSIDIEASRDGFRDADEREEWNHVLSQVRREKEWVEEKLTAWVSERAAVAGTVSSIKDSLKRTESRTMETSHDLVEKLRAAEEQAKCADEDVRRLREELWRAEERARTARDAVTAVRATLGEVKESACLKLKANLNNEERRLLAIEDRGGALQIEHTRALGDLEALLVREQQRHFFHEFGRYGLTLCDNAVDEIRKMGASGSGSLCSPLRDAVMVIERESEFLLSDVEDKRSQCEASLQSVVRDLSTFQLDSKRLRDKIAEMDRRAPELEHQKKLAVQSRDFKAATAISRDQKDLSQDRDDASEALDTLLQSIFMKEREISMMEKTLCNFNEQLKQTKEKKIIRKIEALQSLVHGLEDVARVDPSIVARVTDEISLVKDELGALEGDLYEIRGLPRPASRINDADLAKMHEPRRGDGDGGDGGTERSGSGRPTMDPTMFVSSQSSDALVALDLSQFLSASAESMIAPVFNVADDDLLGLLSSSGATGNDYSGRGAVTAEACDSGGGGGGGDAARSLSSSLSAYEMEPAAAEEGDLIQL